MTHYIVTAITIVLTLSYGAHFILTTPTQSKARIDTDQFAGEQLKETWDSLRIGVATSPIPILEQGALAGYGGLQSRVIQGTKNPVFIKAVVFDNATDRKMAMISADLLIIHPELYQLVVEKLPTIDWSIDQVYFGATHSHSSVGNWAPGFFGEIMAGPFRNDYLVQLADLIVNTIDRAASSTETGSINFGYFSTGNLVSNRIDKSLDVDDRLKFIHFLTGSTSGIIAIYAAHATVESKRNKLISGDYPGYLVEEIEREKDFGMFLAGPVGSVKPNNLKGHDNFSRAKAYANSIVQQLKLILMLSGEFQGSGKFGIVKVGYQPGPPQLKITNSLVLRPYIFKWLFGNYDLQISIMRLDDILLIGLPCDFSGELANDLHTYASKNGFNLAITSFNGGYMGYVISDEHYDKDHFEARDMSWYGRNAGSEMTGNIKKLIKQAAQ